MRKLAIVILNWNGADMLRKYLPTVLDNSVGDVIVADNASDDGSMKMMLTEFPHVHCVVLEQNYGFAEGYNRALAQLPDYEYYLLLNSDVEIRDKQWDAPMIKYMDGHPECAACQPKLMSLREPDMFEYAGGAGGYMDKYGYPFCRGRVMGTIEKDCGQYDDMVPLMWATGAALMIRATDWRDSGGLDGRFFAHMEEIDLCWRLRTMGKSIVCVSGSRAYHLGGATLNQGNPRKTFLNFRNNLLMLYKNLPNRELAHVMAVRALLDYVAAMQFLLKGDVANFSAVLKARKAFFSMRRDFDRDRRHVQQLRKNERVPERVGFLLLWKYYVEGKHTFAKLISK